MPHLTAIVALLTASPAQAPAKNYDLLHVAFRLMFDEVRRTIEAEVTNRVSMSESGGARIAFDAKGLSISSALVDGKPSRFAISGEKVVVDLPAARSQTLYVTLRYTAAPTGGLYFVADSDAWPARTGMVYTKGQPEYNKQWLATYGYPDDKATSECWISCAPERTVVSNGVLVGVEKSPTAWTYHWRMDQPHPTYLIAFASGDFSQVIERGSRVPVEYYVPMGLESQGAAAFSGTDRMLSFFEGLLGFQYPFDRFSQLVAGDYVTGGMENSTVVINNISTLHEPYEKPLADSTGLVAHELAHQWFGDCVTCKDWSHLWINEGFATFLPLFWTRETEGGDEYDLSRKGLIAGVSTRASAGDTPIVKGFDSDNIESVYRGAVYGGAAARLGMLMDHLGEERFWRAVGAFLKENAYRSIDTNAFFQSVSRTSGEDLTWFQRQWFESKGIPVIDLTIGGDRTTTVLYGGGWDIDVPLWTYRLGRWESRTLKMPAGGGKWEVSGADPFLVDPERRIVLITNSGPTFPAESALEAWRAAPSASLKDALLPSLSPQDAVALIAEERNSTMRTRLVSKLGQENASFLTSLFDDPDRKVANAAIARSGVCEPTTALIAALQRVMEKDSNPRIRCNALERTYFLTKDASLLEKAWTTPAPDECFKRFALREWAKTEPDKARRLCLALARNSQNFNLRTLAIDLLGSLKDAPGSREVFNVLIQIVNMEKSYRPRIEAADALATYGDRLALNAIKSLTSEGHTRFTNRIKSAVRRLENVN